MSLVGSRTWAAAVCLVAAAVMGNSQSQQPAVPLPTVVAAAMPSQFALATQAHITGTARLRVYTDGEKVQLSVVVQAPSLLGKAAQENLKTWRFAPHVPTSFEVTFRLNVIDRRNPDPCGPKRNDPRIDPETVSTFRFPTEVEIESVLDPVYICDPSATLFNTPVFEIRGIVICDCEGHRPIADAEVVVGDSTAAPHRARTDADGRFSVPATEWGKNDLLVQKPGYFERFYQVTFLPLPWYRRGNLELVIQPDPGAGQPPPRTRAFLIPTTVPFYPSAAREKNVDGEVRLHVAPGGELTPVVGPLTLLEPTFETARTWRVRAGNDAAELRFNYKLIDDDCLGGGPLITLRGSHDIEVVAKRIAPCGAGKDAHPSRHP